MAQVPNRYYNSPWIADAARNLSLAIAGDPEREAGRLQQQQIQANMARQQEMDRLAIEDRTRAASARSALAGIVIAPEADIPLKMSEAIGYGASPEATFTAAGTASPKYRQQAGLKEMQLSNALDIANFKAEVAKQLADQRDETTRRGQDRTYDASIYGTDTRALTAEKLAAMREKLARLKGPDGKPLDISPQDVFNLNGQVLTLANNMGGRLDPATVDSITTRAAQHYQHTRNAATAAALAFQDIVGADPEIRPGKKAFLFGDDEPAQLIPRHPMTVDEILRSPPGAAAPVPSAPPATPAPGNFSSPFMNPLDPTGGAFMQPQYGPRISNLPASAPAANLPVMNSPAEARLKLKPGDAFMTPDGRTMVLK